MAATATGVVAAVEHAAVCRQLAVEVVLPLLVGVVFAHQIRHRGVVAEVGGEAVGNERRVGSRTALAVLHLDADASVVDEGAGGAVGVGEVFAGIGIGHVVPVVVGVLEVGREGLRAEGARLPLIFVVALAMVGVAVGAHDLRHGHGHAASLIGDFVGVGGDGAVVGSRQVPLGGGHLGDVGTLCGGLWCTLTCLALCSREWLGEVDLLFVLREEPAEGFGGGVVVEETVFAVCEDLAGTFVATHDDEGAGGGGGVVEDVVESLTVALCDMCELELGLPLPYGAGVAALSIE